MSKIKEEKIQSSINPALLEKMEKIMEKFSILERIIRIEEEIKNQNKNLQLLMHQIDKRFEAVDKRFEELREDMNNRFEAVDKKFSMMFTFLTVGFSLITILIVVFKFIS